MTKHSDAFGGALAGTWRQAIGTWATSSGAVQCADVQGSTGKYLIDDAQDVGGSDMYAELRISSTQVNSGSNTGPGIRHRASVVTGYQFAANLTSDSHGAWRTVASAEAQMGSNFSAAVASGDMLRIEAAGRTLRYKVNDALVFLVQDTTITDGQRGAVNGYNGAASGDLIQADDFETGLLTDDLVAPFIADWSAQVEGATSGAVITPTVQNPQTGDTVGVLVTIRDAAQTVTAPAGEGWSASIETPSQTGLECYLFVKRWGLGGQTDDTTPTFSIGTGTAGWTATAFTIRNPLHATQPWTSATHAIVASASASNAAAATATAPAATYTGNNATVLRLFASADDNALNAPSTGVLIFGGTTHDSTAGNDMSQAASIREDITVTTNTGTATVAESVNGNDVSAGITLVLTVPSSITPVGAIAETDALLSATRSSSVTTGLLSESDALLPVARTSSKTVGVLSVTDALQPATATHNRTAAVLPEIDVLGAAQRSVSKALGLLSELDALAPASAGHSRLVGALGELDALLAAGTVTPVALLAEVDVLAPATHTTSKMAGLLTELDVVAPAIRGTQRLVSLLAESDVLAGAGRSGAVLVGVLTELDALMGQLSVATDLQLSASDLAPRLVAGDLEAGGRMASDLAPRCSAGDLVARTRTASDLASRLQAGNLE